MFKGKYQVEIKYWHDDRWYELEFLPPRRTRAAAIADAEDNRNLFDLMATFRVRNIKSDKTVWSE